MNETAAYVSSSSGYVSLGSTTLNRARNVFLPALAKTSLYNSPSSNNTIQNQNISIVTENDAFASMHYNSLLHKPMKDTQNVYTSSGYFGISEAYPTRCSVPAYRQCAAPFTHSFTEQ